MPPTRPRSPTCRPRASPCSASPARPPSRRPSSSNLASLLRLTAAPTPRQSPPNRPSRPPPSCSPVVTPSSPGCRPRTTTWSPGRSVRRSRSTSLPTPPDQPMTTVPTRPRPRSRRTVDWRQPRVTSTRPSPPRARRPLRRRFPHQPPSHHRRRRPRPTPDGQSRPLAHPRPGRFHLRPARFRLPPARFRRPRSVPSRRHRPARRRPARFRHLHSVRSRRPLLERYPLRRVPSRRLRLGRCLLRSPPCRHRPERFRHLRSVRSLRLHPGQRRRLLLPARHHPPPDRCLLRPGLGRERRWMPEPWASAARPPLRRRLPPRRRSAKRPHRAGQPRPRARHHLRHPVRAGDGPCRPRPVRPPSNRRGLPLPERLR